MLGVTGAGDRGRWCLLCGIPFLILPRYLERLGTHSLDLSSSRCLLCCVLAMSVWARSDKKLFTLYSQDWIHTYLCSWSNFGTLIALGIVSEHVLRRCFEDTSFTMIRRVPLHHRQAEYVVLT